MSNTFRHRLRGSPDDNELTPYAWARFDSGGGEIIPALRCERCKSLPLSAVIAAEDEIPEVRCRCSGCGGEWRLLLSHLQALRLAVDPPDCDWIAWESEASKAKAFSLGISAAWGLWAFAQPRGSPE